MNYLVVGYGNPSRMDDGVGHYVINQLNQRFGLRSLDLLSEPAADDSDTAEVNGHTVRTLWVQQLDIELAEEFAAADRLLLVDAHLDGPELNRVELAPHYAMGPVAHVVTPPSLLAITEAVYGHVPQTVLYSARGERWDFGDELSPAVQARADRLVEQIVDALAADE